MTPVILFPKMDAMQVREVLTELEEVGYTELHEHDFKGVTIKYAT